MIRGLLRGALGMGTDRRRERVRRRRRLTLARRRFFPPYMVANRFIHARCLAEKRRRRLARRALRVRRGGFMTVAVSMG